MRFRRTNRCHGLNFRESAANGDRPADQVKHAEIVWCIADREDVLWGHVEALEHGGEALPFDKQGSMT